MMLGAHTVTIVRPPARDNHGDPLPGTSTETDVDGCSVQPRTSTETNDLREAVTTGMVAYLPAGVDVRPSDRIRWQGVLYAVDGEPGDWQDLDGVPDHLEVALRRVEG